MNDDRLAQHELEDALRALGRAFRTPTPTDYPERVLRQLDRDAEEAPAEPRTRSVPSRRWTAGRVMAAAAAVLVVAMVLTLTNPTARRAVASWFGFSGIDIRTSPGTTTPTTAGHTRTRPASLHAGREVTLAEAQQASQYRVQEPATLQSPHRIFVRRDEGSVVVTLAYRTAAPLKRTPDTGYALIVTEIYDAGDPVLQKILMTGATAVPERVDDDQAVFVRGPQAIINLDHNTNSHGMPVIHEVAARASANTLIWSHGSTTYRIEGDFSPPVAISIAESLG